MFGNIEIEKKNVYRHETPIFLKDIEIEKVLVSNKVSFGEKDYNKYFAGYLHSDNNVKPLHIMLPRTRAYVKSYDGQTKWMHFLIEDNIRKLEKHNTICYTNSF